MSVPCRFDLPDRARAEPGITKGQLRILAELGIEPNQLFTLGTDQASELIRAYVFAYAWIRTLEAPDHKSRGLLDPDEPIKKFTKHFELPERAPDESDATSAQARILKELEVSGDVCSGLGVDQASVLIRDVAVAVMGRKAIPAIRRAHDATRHG